MAYFKCTRVSGGVKMIVECASDFAGTTITCTDGTHTYQKTCPSSSPYEVEFEGLVAGLYTVSGVVSGQTFTTSILMEDVEGSLSATPDGKTVTPTDDIQIWLHCGNIWNKSYTTLAEVLADSTTLLALMSDNNAVDYMVRSKTWISQKPLIPTMTSATTPSGVASASNTLTQYGYQVWHPYDGDASTSWYATGDSEWVQYEFPTAVCAKAMRYVSNIGTNTQGTNTIVVKGSNDGSTFTDLKSITLDTEGVVGVHDQMFYFADNTTAYKYYRLALTKTEYSGNGQDQIRTLQLFEYPNAGITDNSTAMTDIGANNYCANTLLADADWKEGICNSTYIDSVLNVKVPTMTSNTTPSGTCFGSTNQSSADYYNAFDGNSNTQWQSDNSNLITQGCYVGYQFPSAIKAICAKTAWGSVSSSHAPIYYKIQGSNDGSTWVDLTNERSYINNEASNDVAMLDATTSYSRFRYIYTNTNTMSLRGCVTKGNFYGREDI